MLSAAVGVAKNVRILIRTQPAQHVDLKGTAGDVGVKGAELILAQGELNAGVAYLLLHDGGEQAHGVVGGSFEGQAEADAVGVRRVAGGVEQRRRFVECRGCNVRDGTGRRRGPVLRGQQRVAECGVAAPQRVEHRRPVEAVGKGLAHAGGRAAAGL